jgi:hypothetical protein
VPLIAIHVYKLHIKLSETFPNHLVQANASTSVFTARLIRNFISLDGSQLIRIGLAQCFERILDVVFLFLGYRILCANPPMTCIVGDDVKGYICFWRFGVVM